MALYNQSDLIYKDYQWTAYPNDNPHVTGAPDSTRFNRHEGYEVLYLINKLMPAQGLDQKTDGNKMEKMIRQHLPSSMVMQTEVKKWIADNWANH